jgi:hypothetical protein
MLQRRRLPRRYLLLGLIVLALVTVPVAATQVRWSGSLGRAYWSYPTVSMPVRVGEPVSVAMTPIDNGRPVRIESVRLHRATGGVVLLGSVIFHGGFGWARHFLPRPIFGKPLRAAEGAVLPAHSTLKLVVGLRATEPGRFRIRGIDVLYVERWHGVELRRQAHAGVFVLGCVVPRHHRRGSCPLAPVPS